MRERTLPPKAAALTESMRDVGYSLETAVADLIDNSITAQAQTVEIWLLPNKQPFCMAILDDGNGMTENELIVAMRHGSQNPRQARQKGDLGRFGLGLKTASFSQCRKMTVVSRRDGKLTGAEWDLDFVAEKDDWIIRLLDAEDIAKVAYADKIGKNGTLVLWEKLDRLSENGGKEANESVLYAKLEDIDKHLSLVFQRFMEGIKGKPKLKISINGHELTPFDPFCLNNKATQLMPEETLRVGGDEIHVQPYILPHHSKLSPAEYDFYKDRSDFLNNQGVYIYRNNRLMVWGEWFRLVPKSELTKLARVRIDFPNTLDEFWTIDIKKSRAHPPHQVREELKRILGRITDRSTRVHSGRGQRLFDSVPEPVWIRFPARNGIAYKVNLESPAVAAFLHSLTDQQVDAFKELSGIIELSMPVDAIYSDYSSDPKGLSRGLELDEEETRQKISSVADMLMAAGYVTPEQLRIALKNIKPFASRSELVEEIIKEKTDV